MLHPFLAKKKHEKCKFLSDITNYGDRFWVPISDWNENLQVKKWSKVFDLVLKTVESVNFAMKYKSFVRHLTSHLLYYCSKKCNETHKMYQVVSKKAVRRKLNLFVFPK